MKSLSIYLALFFSPLLVLNLHAQGNPGPIDFEDGGLGAAWTWAVFENVDNPALEIVDNPDTSGANASATVAKFMARQAGAPHAGTNTPDAATFTLDESNSVVKIMVFKSVVSDVGIKFEQGAASTGELKVANTLVDQWEELTFDFSSKIGEPSSSDITGLVLFPDFNDERSSDNVAYFDNLTFSAQEVVPPATMPVGFEDGGSLFSFSDFEGGVASAVDNPGPGGINDSAKVGQMQKFAGASYAGSTLILDGEVDFSAGSVFTMKLWSSREVPVTFKLEGLNVQRIATHTGSSSWEELSFDFDGSTGEGVEAITLIFDNGNVGDADGAPGDWTFFFDGIDLGEAVVVIPPATMPVGFEDGGSLFSFSDFEGGVASAVDNPGPGGINDSAKVGQMQKFAGANYAGSTLILDGEVDFSAGSVFTMKVWSSREVPVTFKLEGLNVQRIATHSGSSSWEELSFDFGGSTSGAGVEAITLIFDNGTVGDAGGAAGDWTFFFDGIDLGEGDGTVLLATLPVGFEDADVPYTFANFEGGVGSVVDNPGPAGINDSPRVARMQKFAGASYGGSTLGLDGVLDFSFGSVLTMKVWSAREVPVTFKLEGLKVERVATHSGSGSWEELSFDFNGSTTGNPVGAITLIFENGTVGDAENTAEDWTFFFDAINLSDGSIIPGPIDFEDGVSEIDSPEGTTVALIANPDRTGLNLSPNVASLVNPGGVESTVSVNLGGKLNLATQSTFQVRVWSPKAGVTVRMILGEMANPTSVGGGSITTLSTTALFRDYVMTKTNEWELLTFNFAGEATNTFDMLTLTFDEGSVDANTYYFDSLSLTEEGADNPHLVNVSTRGMVETGERILIVGFVIEGDSDKSMLIRGVGPALTEFDLVGALSDPYLEIYDADKVKIMENDDWSTGDVTALSDTMLAAGAFALAPDSKDAVIVADFAPGIYTAHLYGVDGATGVGMIEAYETEEDGNRLVNISTRGEVGEGENVLIGGFVVSSNSCTVLIRAAGPAIADYMVEGSLSDPVLQVFDSNGVMIAENDDWSSSTDAVEIDAVGAEVGAFEFGESSNDSAILMTLGAGVYTAQVSGAGNATGVALVEVYEVPENEN